MIDIFESLLPVFLLILLGAALKKISLFPDEYWNGMERLGFYIFLPALLFVILSRMEVGESSAAPVAMASLIGVSVVSTAILLVRFPVQTAFQLSPPGFSSVFQGVTRWNGFVALAIAQKIGGGPSLLTVAIVMAAIIVPLNIINLIVVAWLSEKATSIRGRLFMLLTNPMIIGTLAGIVVAVSGIQIYQPVFETVELLSRATLPLALILVGAALKFRLPSRAFAACIAATGIKLLVVPFLFVAFGYWFGLRGSELVTLAICGGVPTAMNGYIVAKEMGGDAPLFAAISTLQTAAAFLTLPLVILLTRQFAG